MGEPRGGSATGAKASRGSGWRKDDPEAQSALRNFLAGGEKSRFKPRYPLPEPGHRYGEITVLGPGSSGKSDRQIRVRCSCGSPDYEVAFSSLRSGASTRCWSCAIKKAGKTRSELRGTATACPDYRHRRRLLGRISMAISRCHNPKNREWENYGGRGISVYPEWIEDRAKFLAYLTSLPGWDDPRKQMDRVDNDAGYAPGNVRFSTREENMANRRSVGSLQRRIAELERCLRHCTCGATEQVRDPHE